MADNSSIDEASIRAMAALLHEHDLTEIEVVSGDSKLRIARQITAAPTQVMHETVAAEPRQSAMPEPAPSTGPAKSAAGSIASPMVGTAYRAPEPDGRPFVDVGDSVTAGQTVMIVEAMKTMNQIVAEVAGTVTDVFVEDGQPVEYGEPLLAIS